MKGDRLKKIYQSLDECPPEYICKKGNRFKDLTGQKFNYLTALYITGKSNDDKYKWLCRCNNCGKYVEVQSNYLISGHTKSCGCLISEKLRNDLTGKQFGFLKVIRYDCSKNETPYYFVKCLKCGREYSACGSAIQKQLSCGCITSKKAQLILDTFKESSIDYIRNIETEKIFNDCTFREKLKFDFFIQPHKCQPKGILYEYDGEQHYKPVKFSKNTTDTESYRNFISNQIRDWIKDLYCLTNDIPLIRINYSTKKNITFKELNNNSYIVGKHQWYDKFIDVLDINDSDLINYSEPTFNILAGISCTFKCCPNNPEICHNNPLCNQNPIRCEIPKLIERFNNQNLCKTITFQGLECLDNLKQILWFIYHFRKTNNNTIIIWTGYTKDECEDLIYLIKEKMKWENIIIKYGRFIPDQQPHYDEVLGVELASDNQYAERIC